MKKIFLMVLSFLVIATFPSVYAYDGEYRELYDSFISNLEYDKEDITYSFSDRQVKSIDERFIFSYGNKEYSIRIMDYLFFKVENYSVMSDYYVSISSELLDEQVKLIGTIVIPSNTNHNYYFDEATNMTCNLEVFYEINSKLFVNYYVLQDDTFEFIDESSVVIDDIYDDSFLSNRILDLLNYEKHYMLSQLNVSTISIDNEELNDMFESQTRSTYCNNAQTVHYGDYDRYASNRGALDLFINDSDAREYYKTYYSGDLYPTPATDIMLTYIIPKALFTNVGIYSYIGYSYGFCVRTVYTDGDYCSDFIIFEIVQTKNNSVYMGTIEVKPVFKGYVECVSNIGVIYEILGGCKLVLKDINIDIEVLNKNEANIGDTNYCPYVDHGYVVNGYNVTACVNAPVNTPLNLFGIKYLASVFGLIPKYGQPIKWTTIAATSFIESVYNNNLPSYNINLSSTLGCSGAYDASYNWISPSGNRNTIIANYGNLIKGINVNLKNMSNNSDTTVLYYDVNGFNRLFVEYAFLHDAAYGHYDSIIQTKITMGIYESDDLDTMIDSVTNSWAEEFNQSREPSTHTIAVDTPTEVEYKLNGYQSYTFSPITSGIYVVETFGTECDTYVEVYMGNNLVTADDNSGYYVNHSNQSTCSRIQIPMMNNYTFTIKVRGNNLAGGGTNEGYTYLIGKRWKADLEEQVTSSGFSYIEGYSVWQEFTATRSDCYDSFTVSYTSSVDTYIELYDLNHNLIAFCDAYDSTHHGRISLYIEQGDTYLVRTKHMGSVYSEREFGVVVGKVEEINSLQTNMNYYTTNEIMKGYNDVIIYHFKPKYTADYKFYTTYSSGTQDVVMYLFDEDFNQLAYDDDSNGSFQPKIVYNCKYWYTYYVMVKHYSASNNQWTWFNFFAKEN